MKTVTAVRLCGAAAGAAAVESKQGGRGRGSLAAVLLRVGGGVPERESGPATARCHKYPAMLPGGATESSSLPWYNCTHPQNRTGGLKGGSRRAPVRGSSVAHWWICQ